MQENSFSWEMFNAAPIVGIMRNFKQSDIENILPAFADGGLNTIEVTMNSAGAEESIRYARTNFAEKLNVGAGTVLTDNDLDAALQAGAQFIVTPVVNFSIIERCKQLAVPIFPGAYTPTEIFNAWNAGATMVKVFPMVGNAIEYIKAVRAPLPQIKLLPTGGVSIDNLHQFFEAGVSGVGVGSHLFDKQLIKNKDWNALRNHFRRFAQRGSEKVKSQM